MVSRFICRIVLVFIMATCFSSVGCDKVRMNVGKPPAWEIVMDFGGQQIKFPLEVQNVYLVEDEGRYPETF